MSMSSAARQHRGFGEGRGDKLYDEPGVGSRTGMRFADGAFDLDEFIEAGRRAMKQQSRRSAESFHVRSDSSIAGDSDEESVGTARGLATEIRASSSMLLVESPGPSPRSTIRQSQAPSSSPFLSSPGTARNHSPSPLLLPLKKSFVRHSLSKSSDGDVIHSTSSPSKSRLPRKRVIATGLGARKEKKRIEEEMEQNKRKSRIRVDSPLKDSSIISHNSEGEEDDQQPNEVVSEDGNDEDEEEETQYIVESDVVGNDVEVDLQDFQPQSSEGLEQVHISPQSGKTATTALKPSKAVQNSLTRSILQEKNGGAIQSSSSTALSKARQRAKEGPVKKRKAIDDKEGLDHRKVVEKIHPSYHRQESVDDSQGQEEGLRRGSRYRYKPLEFWRGEKARFGRPSLPKVRDEEDVGDETIDGDAFEDHFAGSIPPVAVLKEIIRVPREEGEGTFSGMKIRKERAVEPVRKRPHLKESKRNSEPDPSLPTRHAESGWDNSTEMKASVWNAEDEKEIELQVACTSSQVRPRLAINSTFGFEKIFVIDHTLASGILFILVNGEKPLKSSKANNYTFVVLEGAVKIHLHKSEFVIAPHGMFFVPAGNDYSIQNVCKRTAKIAFTQCRNRTT